MDLSLFVKPGQPITAALWNQLVAAARSCRILAGNGIRLRHTPDGTLIACTSWRPWNHPFKVTLSGTGATIHRGLVNTTEPEIDGVPIGGDGIRPPPRLEIGEPRLDETGRGWIAIEVTCEPQRWTVESATIVQVGALRATDPAKGLHPLAMIRRSRDGGLDLFQIAFFNVQHRAEVRGDGPQARHFFWAA